jgi:outer membrane receptor protein involved in Fe transport
VQASVRAILLAAALPAFAAGAAESADDDIETLEVVEVTGSRITRPAEDSPNPVIAISAVEIEQSGLTNLTDILVQSPQLVSSITTSDSSGTSDYPAGVNLLNLRNLGTDRTLVLVNGRRHIAGIPGSAAVDVNSIPMDLVERVDVLTGGVSAVYGADGVSGVVNFITKRNFDGLAVRGQLGLSQYGDAGSDFASITAGHNFAGGRGNVAIAYEYSGDDAVYMSARKRGGDPLHSYSFAFNPDDPDDDPAIYDRIPVNDLRWADSSPDGAIDADADLVPDFRGGGQPYDLGNPFYDNGWVQGGSSTPRAGYFGDLQAKTQKHVANLLGSFDFSESARLFFEGKYARTKTWNLSQPTYEYYTIGQADNPFLPASIRDSIAPGGIDFLFRYFGVIAEDDPETIPDGVFITRDNYDLSIKGDTVTRDTIRTTAGMDGRISDHLKYEFSYTFGQTKIEYDQPGHRIDERFFAALDAVDEGEFLTGTPNGNIRCRIDLQPAGTMISPYNIMWGPFAPGGDGSGTPQTFTAGAGSGCVPLNIFGEGVADPAAIDWIGYRMVDRSKINQHVVSGSLSGDLGALFELPGGPLAWAVGAEYRKEKSVYNPDPILEQELLWGWGYVTDEVGSFNVKEAFGEVNLPLVKDALYAKNLSIGAAVRLSDYSTVGKTTTWKTDLVWAPSSELSFRGTYSVAVRAPNITELFAPTQGTFESIYDPCDTSYIQDSDDPALRAANCAAILQPLGVNLASFHPAGVAEFSTTTQPGQSGGNPNLSEEKATTWTAGIVLRPEAAPGLSISFDWYDIKLENAISTATAQQVINLCVDSPMPNNYCDSVQRLSAPEGTFGTGFISGYLIGPQNVAQYTTAGADVNIAWTFTLDPDWGKFHFGMNGGYLDDLTFISLPGAPPSDRKMNTYAPKYTANGDLTWTKNGFIVNYGVNFFSKTRRFSEALKAAQPDVADPKYFYYKEKWVHDLRVSHDWDNGIRLYAGVNNLYDAKPAFDDFNYPVTWVGRFFYTGVNYNLK